MSNSYSVFIKPRFRDLDGLAHVNNAVFLSYLEFARSEWFLELHPDASPNDFNFILARVEIDYKSPITIRDHVEVYMQVSHIGNKSWDFVYQIRHRDTKKVFALAKTTQVYFNYIEKLTLPLTEEMREVFSKISV